MRAAYLILGVLTLSLIPGATAQTPPPSVHIKVMPYDGLLMPETGQAAVRMQTTVMCNPGYVSLEPTKLTLRFASLPSFAGAVIEPSHFSYQFQAQECVPNGGRRIFESTVRVSVTRDAPAYFDGIYEVQAIVQQPNPVGSQTSQARAVFPIKNDYMANVEVRAGVLQMSTAPNGVVTFPFEVINHGNGPSRTQVILQPDPVAGLDLVNPGGDVVLESRAMRGDDAAFRAARHIEVVAGATPGVYHFHAIFRSGYDGAVSVPSSTDETTIGFAVIVDGEAAPAGSGKLAGDEAPALPAPMTPLVGLLLLGVALWRRRQG